MFRKSVRTFPTGLPPRPGSRIDIRGRVRSIGVVLVERATRIPPHRGDWPVVEQGLCRSREFEKH
jgi:hypothetical protein